MITRLVEAHYAQHAGHVDAARGTFWLRELRTPVILCAVANAEPTVCEDMVVERPLLKLALAGDLDSLAGALREEEDRERAADRVYWAPLKRELEYLRHSGHG